MSSFNSKEYAWIDVKLVMLGKEVTGLRGIEYKMKRQKECLLQPERRHAVFS